MRIFIFSGLIILFSLPAWKNAHAQAVGHTSVFPNADTVPGHTTLRPVTIYTRHLTQKETIIAPAQILLRAELQQINSLSVADAVRFLSGVQLKDYGGIGGLKTINVRSMGTNHTAVFYDGIQIGNAQNGQTDLGKFSLDNLESIGLYNGQKASIFQPAEAFAAGASLFLESQSPVFKPNEKRHISAAFKTGSFGLLNPTFLWQQKTGKRFSASLSAETIHAHGRYPFRYTNGTYDTTAIRMNADVQSQRVEGSLHGRFGDSSTLRIRFYTYHSQRGLPGAVVANHFENYQRLWNNDHFLQISYEKPVNSWYRFRASSKISGSYTRYLDPFYQNIEGKLDNRFRESSAYFSVTNGLQLLPNWSAAISADYKSSSLNANLYRFPYPTRNTLLTVLATDLQVQRLALQGNVLATFVSDKTKEYTAAGSKTEFTPSLHASWQPFRRSDFHFRAFYKNIFRMPTFNDLYYTFIGNVKLKPEYAEQYNAGFIYGKYMNHPFFKSIMFSGDAYHNLVTDKIVALPGTNLFRWSMMNLGRVDIKGLDIVVKNTFQADSILFSTGLQYTFQKALNVTSGWYNYGDQIPYTPRHSGSLTVSATLKNWHVNYSFIYTGERYSLPANIPANYVPAWYTHDLAFSRSHILKQNNLKLSAEIMNLANQYYDVVLNYPMPGRSFRLSLNFKL